MDVFDKPKPKPWRKWYWMGVFAFGAAGLCLVAYVSQSAAMVAGLYGWIWGGWCRERMDLADRELAERKVSRPTGWDFALGVALIVVAASVIGWSLATLHGAHESAQRAAEPVRIHSEGAVTITHGTERIRIEVAK